MAKSQLITQQPTHSQVYFHARLTGNICTIFILIQLVYYTVETVQLSSEAVIRHVCVLAYMCLFALVMVVIGTCLPLYVNAWLPPQPTFIHPDTDTFYSGWDQHFLGS